MQIEGRCGNMVIGRCSSSLLRMARRACTSQAASIPLASLRSATVTAALPHVAALPSRCSDDLGAVGPRRSTTSLPRSSLLGASSLLSSRQIAHLAPVAAAAAVDAVAAAAPAEPAAPMTLADLPTSDESDALLRIRHSVSFKGTIYAFNNCIVKYQCSSCILSISGAHLSQIIGL